MKHFSFPSDSNHGPFTLRRKNPGKFYPYYMRRFRINRLKNPNVHKNDTAFPFVRRWIVRSNLRSRWLVSSLGNVLDRVRINSAELFLLLLAISKRGLIDSPYKLRSSLWFRSKRANPFQRLRRYRKSVKRFFGSTYCVSSINIK